MATFSNPFPSWGDTGSSPGVGKDYGAEQVFADHFDYLWDQLNKTFNNIISEFDNEVIRADGSVAMAADLQIGDNAIDLGNAGSLTIEDSGTTQQEFASIDGSDNLTLFSGSFTSVETDGPVHALLGGSTYPTGGGHSFSTPIEIVADGANERGAGLMLFADQDPGGNVDQDKADIYWMAADGEILARVGAHEADNKFSIYTRDETAFDGSQGSHYKRLNIDGGGQTGSQINWESLQRWQFRGDYGNNDEIRMEIYSDSGAHSYMQWYDGGNIGMEQRWHASDEDMMFRLRDTLGADNVAATPLRLNGVNGDGQAIIDEHVQSPGDATNPALQLGTGGAGFFVNGSGEVVVVDEGGNTTTLS